MAVSKALRGHSSISRQRRIEIKAIAERIGYQPNISAISLRGGKSHSIGILWGLGGPHDSIGLIRDISLKLMDNDHVSYIADSLGDPKIINSCLKDYVARNVDGLIIQVHSKVDRDNLLTAEVSQYLKQIGNVVIVNDTETDLPDELQYDEIKRQRLPAIKEIIAYLASRGRQRIVMLSRILSPWREQQFIDCLKAHKLDSKNCRLINPSGSSAFIPDETLEQLKVSLGKYDAILASNDQAAAQVIKYLQQYDVKVPEDIAVVGFNDSLLGPYITPPIASVNRCSPEIAAAIVELMMRRINNENADLQQLEFPMRFIKRESAG
jgi:LacI family transcriptional regulator